MKNIILLTHGEFSKGIAQSCRFILGEVPNLTPLSITLNETVGETKTMVEQAMEAFDNDAPTMVITDIPGGSTTQAALQVLADHPETWLVTGLNLGLLVALIMLELTGDRETDSGKIKKVLAQARDTMTLVNDMTAEDMLSDEEGEL